MLRILLSNDDGVHAEGLKAIRQGLGRLGKVWVVAPLQEMSTTGHSLTIHKPLRLIPMGERFYGVNGSPADCVYLGLREVLKGMPDVVVSGINRGANLGQDVFYSGTVSAAREAAILGIPAVAVSLAVDFKKNLPESRLHYSTAAAVAVDVLRKILKKRSERLPRGTLLNLNVPDVPLTRVRGVQVTRQGFRHYSGEVVKRRDHRGKDYFWVGGSYRGFEGGEGSDCHAVNDRYASLTPLKLDTTDSKVADLLNGWVGA